MVFASPIFLFFFLPLTLEMGSWIWVKKNPRQLFSRSQHAPGRLFLVPAGGGAR